MRRAQLSPPLVQFALSYRGNRVAIFTAPFAAWSTANSTTSSPLTMGSRVEAHFDSRSGRRVLFRTTANTSSPAQIVRTNTTATMDSSDARSRWQEAPGFQVGIYGWRKRCLYLLIMCLLVVVIINLALTLWVLKVMEFSSDGMGLLRIVPGGVQLHGQATVLDTLVASTIKSRRRQPLSIDAANNFTVTARNPDGSVASKMTLSKEKLEHMSRKFEVKDTRGTTLFSANKDEVVVGADVLRVTGAGGAIFDGTVQVPLVQAPPGHELRLESPTRSLEVKAPQGILMESRAGDIGASCLNDLKLKSYAGAVRLHADNIYFPNLRKTSNNPKRPSRSERVLQYTGDVYQLCACENGRLFLAPPLGVCTADENAYICR